VVWAFAAALYTVARSSELKYWFWMLESTCALISIPLQLFVVLEYTGSERWSTRRSLLLLYLPSLLFAGIALIASESLYTVEVHSGVEVLVGNELVRWLFVSYSFVVIFITLGVLFNWLLRAPAFRLPILLIMLGLILTVASTVVLDPQWLTVPPIQITVLLNNFIALSYFIALYNYRLLWVVPLARDTVISNMPYSLFVLDAEDRLVDFNPAAQSLPGLPGMLILRQTSSRALGNWWEKVAPLIGSEYVVQDFQIETDAGMQVFRVVSLPLRQPSGRRMGQALLLEDVTQARQEQQQWNQVLWAQATLQEREQLADELHDGLSQNLAFLNLQAQAAQIYLQSGQDESARSSLERLTEASGQIQEETRQLIDNLLSISLPAENFCTTLRRILAGFEEQTGLSIHLDLDGSESSEENIESCQLPPLVAVQLARIAQEALANVRKHAQDASQVRVELKKMDGQVSLLIEDDGSGFDPIASQAEGKHFGLQVMKQRAARIGGHLEISSTPEMGTCIEVYVPLVTNG